MNEDPQLGCRDQHRLSDERSGEKFRQLIAVGQHRLYDIGGVKDKTRQMPGTNSDMSGVKTSPGSSSAAWHTGSAERCRANIHIHLDEVHT
jgi:hypothetical protein